MQYEKNVERKTKMYKQQNLQEGKWGGRGATVIYKEGSESWFAVTAFYACHWQIDILKICSWLLFHVSIFVQAISGLMKGISIKDEILSLLYWNAQGGSRGKMEQWKLHREFLKHLADTGRGSLGMPGAMHSVAWFTKKQCAFVLVPTAWSHISLKQGAKGLINPNLV